MYSLLEWKPGLYLSMRLTMFLIRLYLWIFTLGACLTATDWALSCFILAFIIIISSKSLHRNYCSKSTTSYSQPTASSNNTSSSSCSQSHSSCLPWLPRRRLQLLPQDEAQRNSDHTLPTTSYKGNLTRPSYKYSKWPSKCPATTWTPHQLPEAEDRCHQEREQDYQGHPTRREKNRKYDP